MVSARLLLLAAVAAFSIACAAKTSVTNRKSVPAAPWWPASTAKALARAGSNRAELGRALRTVPVSQRAAMRFLIENAPDRDLRTLDAKYLLAHVALAFQARDSAPWRARISHELFLNDVLPYAFLNEERDNSRAMLRAKSLPLIVGAKSPGEAAHAINQRLFPLVKVKYSTQRKKPHQNASECMATGLASCSGLSILLAAACRSVGVPARVVGTPMWANGRGNHTWVEVWDGGWHFVGAAEPDEKGLDHGWFVGDAAQARADVPANAIYASTWKKSGTSFPLVWAPNDKSVPAVNVTARYARAAPKADAGKTRLLLQFLNSAGQRAAVPVVVLGADGKEIGRGVTKSESADANDFFSVSVPRHSAAVAIFTVDGLRYEVKAAVADQAEAKLALDLRAAPALPKYLPPAVKPLTVADQAAVEQAAGKYFVLPAEQREAHIFPNHARLHALLRQNESGVRAAVWSAWKKAPHAEARADFEASRVRFDKHESPYVVRTVGERPANGWPLFIAMHGGGGAPKEVNDSQWQGMQRHYKDHPELGGYKYLALRAPNDTWNGFYDDYVYPLIGNLTANFNLFGDIDPNKVFALGYSHGGYGAYAIGPKMPDHFAAVHSSAAAATDGETSAKTLRSTVFTAMVGERDLAYDRLSRNQKFAALIETLRGDRKDIYPVRVDVAMGFEHGNLNDRDKIVEMYPHTRNPIPREISWEQTDGVIRDFFWLTSENPAKAREVSAARHGNRITVTTKNDAAGWVLLDARMVDFSRPVEIEVDGHNTRRTVHPSLKTLCDTMARRGDPELAFSAQVPFT
jgi:predicted esterase